MPFSNAAYDPEPLAMLTRAFDDACKEQHVGGAGHIASRAGRTLMALRLMTAAAGGERDHQRLKLAAVYAVEGRWSIDIGH
jgi:hypothetical protein